MGSFHLPPVDRALVESYANEVSKRIQGHGGPSFFVGHTSDAEHSGDALIESNGAQITRHWGTKADYLQILDGALQKVIPQNAPAAPETETPADGGTGSTDNA